MAVHDARPTLRRGLVATAALLLFLSSLSMTQGHAVPESWTTGTMAPAPTEGTQGAFIGNLFYHYDHGSLYTYDPATNTWAFVSTGPGVNHEGVGAAAVGPGGPVFIAMGMGGVEVYDVTSGTWSLGTAMPTPRNGLGAATVGNLVYAVGGKMCGGVGCGAGMNTVEVYDPMTNAWAPGPVLPVPVSDVYATVGQGTDVYAFGGWDGAADRNDMQVLDTTTGIWSLGPAMPTARGNAVAGVCGDHIYVVGGLQLTTFTYLTTVERFDLQTGTWGAAPSLPGPMAEMSAGLVSDGAGFLVATTGQAGTMQDTYVMSIGDCRPTGDVTCEAIAVEIVETDLSLGIGSTSTTYSKSTAAATPGSGGVLLPSGPMDPPVSPSATGTAHAAGFSYSHPSGISVEAAAVHSECSVYAGASAHAYGHAGIEDLVISTAAGPLLVAEAMDFELNAYGTTSIQGNYACDVAEVDLVPPPQTAAFCTTNSLSPVGPPLQVDLHLGQATGAGGAYDGSILHVRVTQTGNVQVDLYIGHVEVDLSSYSTTAAGPTYIGNGPCLTVVCN